MGIYFSLITSLALAAQPVLATGSMSSALALLSQKNSTASTAIEAPKPQAKETRSMWVTAYSSTPEETDDTPFLTASGTQTRDGIVATNMLPFGTKVQIPALFGDKVFVVEDRMHPRKEGYIDVWMPTKTSALRIGITKTDVLVLAE